MEAFYFLRAFLTINKLSKICTLVLSFQTNSILRRTPQKTALLSLCKNVSTKFPKGMNGRLFQDANCADSIHTSENLYLETKKEVLLYPAWGAVTGAAGSVWSPSHCYNGSSFKFLFMCMFGKSWCVPFARRCRRRPEEGVISSMSGLTHGCEPGVDVGNWTWVLQKSSKCF